jgi:hypothetical protein
MEIFMHQNLLTPARRFGSMRRVRIVTAAAMAIAASTMATALAEAAQASPANFPKLSPAEVTAPAATIVSETPYQSQVTLECNSASTTCVGRLAQVPATDRLAIQFVSCTAHGQVKAILRYFMMQITDAKVTRELGIHYIAPSYQSPADPYIYIVSQPIQLTAQPTNFVYLTATSTGAGIVNVRCGVSGVRQRLR